MSKQIVTTDQELLDKARQEEKRLKDALAAAREGDPDELNRMFDLCPEMGRRAGKLYLEAEQGLLAWWPGWGNAPRLYLQQMREDLGYDVSGGLERLLIDRIVVCWLRVQQAEEIVTSKDKERLTPEQRNPFHRRVEVANKTFLRACKTLAEVQRLLKRDTTQINILAQQQVNIATEDSRSITD